MTQQTPSGLTYPEPSDHTRTWEHWQTLAENVDARLQAMGTLWVESGAPRRDFQPVSVGQYAPLVPTFTLDVSNPLDVPVLVRADCSIWLYVNGPDQTYVRVTGTGATLSVLGRVPSRTDYPDGDTGLYYDSIRALSWFELGANASMTLEVQGHHTGTTVGEVYTSANGGLFASIYGTRGT